MADHGTGGTLNTRTLTTIENYRKGPFYDQVTRGIGIWRYMREHSLVTYEELVGREEIVTLDVGKDSNGQDFDDLDVMTLGPTDELKDARIGRYNYRTGFYIGDIETMENAGNAKNHSLLKTKLNTMTRQARVDMAKRLCGSQGSNTKRCEGIRDVMGGAVVAADETPVSTTLFTNTTPSQAELHGLNCYDVDGEDYANLWAVVYKRCTSLGNNNGNIEDMMTRAWMELRNWGGDPKVGICDQLFYIHYSQMRGAAASRGLVSAANAYPTPIPGDKPGGRVSKFGPGLADLFWNGKPIIYDPYVTVPSTFTSGTDGHCNWIDTDFFEIVIDPRANWKRLDPRKRSGEDQQYVDKYQVWIRYTTRVLKRNAHCITVLDL